MWNHVIVGFPNRFKDRSPDFELDRLRKYHGSHQKNSYKGKQAHISILNRKSILWWEARTIIYSNKMMRLENKFYASIMINVIIKQNLILEKEKWIQQLNKTQKKDMSFILRLSKRIYNLETNNQWFLQDLKFTMSKKVLVQEPSTRLPIMNLVGTNMLSPTNLPTSDPSKAKDTLKEHKFNLQDIMREGQPIMEDNKF